MWKDIDIKFSDENSLRGSEYSLSDCMYLLMGLENIPKVFMPGNSDSRERINELAEDDE